MPDNNNITELFDRIRILIDDEALSPLTRNKILHETLVLTCNEALKDTRFGFGDLNSQVETLISRYHIQDNEADAIRQMRRDSNRREPLSHDVLLHDARALAVFISRVLHVSIPDALTKRLPRDLFSKERRPAVNSPNKRCIVRSWDDSEIRVIIDEDGDRVNFRVPYTEETQYARMDYLSTILREGMHLNLLNCHVEGDTIRPQLIVVEPDFLVDISTIASCFEDYGHHPLLYLVSRLRDRANTQAILLGNFAGSVLDDVINQPRPVAGRPAPQPYSMGRTLIRNFREKALEYATCREFNAVAFKKDAQQQAKNIVDIVAELRKYYDLGQAVLEPTFVCESLGLQGRVDLMTTNLSLLVEQKSGRNMFLEHNCPNRYGNKSVEKHYVQLLLYFGILYNNFHGKQNDEFLLYSKFGLPGGLLKVANLMKLFYEAIRFRNEAVALEFDMAESGVERYLPMLTVDELNTEHLSSFFFNRYLEPQLSATLVPLADMQPLEHAYFCRMARFVIRENLLGKVGVNETMGNAASDLWNMPLAEKKETGNIYTDLRMVSLHKSTYLKKVGVAAGASSNDEGKSQANGKDGSQASAFSRLLALADMALSPEEVEAERLSPGGYDLVTLAVPDQGTDFLPNFRRGDMVYLYAYAAGAEPDVRHAMLFKGGLADIRSDRVVVKLSDGQQNPAVLEQTPLDVKSIKEKPPRRRWCIEHSGSDSGGGMALRSLYAFISAPKERRDLLLGQRAPRRDASLMLSRSYDPALDDLLLRAKQAKDYFLLVGPPGTGKTSRALQFLVREAAGSSVLLTAYTNRAVDEICGMLVENGIDFLRVGNELSCAPAFTPWLLQNKVGEKPTLDGMKRLLQEARIVVATTSTLQSRSYLFSLKHFDLAIVDEASQILEPGLVGLLGSHRGTEGMDVAPQCDISKFILIGDYKQLPAVVRQGPSESEVYEPQLRRIGLTSCRASLFERLIHTEVAAGRTQFIGTLRRQGRMHPEIADFPNHAFYFSEHLVTVPVGHQLEKRLDYGLPSQDRLDDLLKAHRMLFFASRDCAQPEISDKVNADEADLVARLLCRIYRFYGDSFNLDTTVGVIVPYRNQIAMIRRAVERTDIEALRHVSVDTVERYQGSQRDVIIYSFTIQRRYQLSFLTANTFVEDGHTIDRKLNVALTRARKQLLLTGNVRTLSANRLFNGLIRYIRLHGGFVSESDRDDEPQPQKE